MADNKQTGFALLVALIVVGAVLSVGLVILDLTIKQVRLAATTKDSEIAFHAANAGMECARYWRRTESDAMVVGGDVSGDLNCFGVAATNYTHTSDPVSLSGPGSVEQYEYEFSWGPTDARRCTRVNQVIIATPAGVGDSEMSASQMETLIPGYQAGNSSVTNITCQAGSQCTTLSVQGYNQECPSGTDQFGFGVVERKVLLEF